MAKSGFVAIIGKPNVGKSTFLNYVLGTKIAITSPRPQTTRNTILGIYTSDSSQIVFMDTPGIYKTKNKLNDLMLKMAYQSIASVDLVLYMINEYDKITDEDIEILKSIKNQNVKTFLIVNKVDLIKKMDTFLSRVEEFKQSYDFDGAFAISALQGDNVDKLLKDIENELEEGPYFFPEDQITDKPEKFLVAEFIREKILYLTKEEVPHSVMVEIEEYKVKKAITEIRAAIILERPSHKPIIIGKGGSMIKRIGQEARVDIENFLNQKVFLDLFVKVEEDWRNRDYYLKNFGFKQEIE